MESNIEDNIFFNLVKRYKEDYTPSKYSHRCSMCNELDNNKGYALRHDIVANLENPMSVPYIFICKDCYDSLPHREDK